MEELPVRLHRGTPISVGSGFENVQETTKDTGGYTGQNLGWVVNKLSKEIEIRNNIIRKITMKNKELETKFRKTENELLRLRELCSWSLSQLSVGNENETEQKFTKHNNRETNSSDIYDEKMSQLEAKVDATCKQNALLIEELQKLREKDEMVMQHLGLSTGQIPPTQLEPCTTRRGNSTNEGDSIDSKRSSKNTSFPLALTNSNHNDSSEHHESFGLVIEMREAQHSVSMEGNELLSPMNVRATKAPKVSKQLGSLNIGEFE